MFNDDGGEVIFLIIIFALVFSFTDGCDLTYDTQQNNIILEDKHITNNNDTLSHVFSYNDSLETNVSRRTYDYYNVGDTINLINGNVDTTEIN